MVTLIRHVHIIDPTAGLDGVYTLILENGKILEITQKDSSLMVVDEVIEGQGKILIPGLFDMHVHLREPGYEHKEDIASGTRAAARGGVTGVLAMPNTSPVVEDSHIVRDIKARIHEKAVVGVELTGSITKGLKGDVLSNLEDMFCEGIIAITDDGRTTMSEILMRQAMQIIKGPGAVLISHAEDHDMVVGGAMHEGQVSKDLHIKGIPAEAEYKIVRRDIALAKETGAKLHIAHISTKESVEAVREARANGLPVTAEAGPHHFMLTDEVVRVKGALAKVNPPLRSEEHRLAVEEGILDGTIDCIATDHAPHTLEEKSKGMDESPFGISGVELSLTLCYTHFVKSKKLTWPSLVQKMAIGPRSLLGLEVPSIRVGSMAEFVLFNPNAERVLVNADLTSRGKNTPYEGMRLYGDVEGTWYNGKCVYRGEGMKVKGD
jgi:dihydroorotase